MADLIPPIIVSIEANAAQFEAQVGALQGKMQGLGTSVQAAQTPMQGLTKTLGALGIAFGAYQVIQFGKDLINAAEAEQVANDRLENITDSMGLFGGAADEVTGRLEALATQTALNVGLDDAQIKATQAKLMTFKELAATADEAGGAFDRATMAAIDMAAAGFGEAETNAVQLGKALNDPIKGITALSRSGITFTEQEKEQIKTLVEHNDMLGAQRLVLGAIEKQVGGTAEATATSTDKMGAAFGELQESIGLALLPTINSLADGLAATFNWIGENLPVVGTFVGVLGGLAIALNLTAIATWIQTSALWAMAAALLANPITWIVLAVAALAAGIVWLATKTTFFQDAWDAMSKWITDAWNWVVTGISDGIDAIVTFFEDLPKNIMKFFQDAVDWLYDTGKNMIQGLIDGAASLLTNIGNFFLDLLPSWIVDPFKAALGIASPSKVFHGFGQNIVQGLMDGVDSKSGELAGTMNGLADTTATAFETTLSASGSLVGSYGTGSVAASYVAAGGVSTGAMGQSGKSVSINAPVSVHTNANAQDISASIVNAIKFNLPYITTGALA